MWEYLQRSDANIIQQFGTMVIGIGALFFAYGQTYSSFHLRLVVALIGFGSSLILATYFYGIRKDREAIEKSLKGTQLLVRYKGVTAWRDEGMNRVFYHPVTRLFTYFSGLVAIVWLMIVTTSLASLFGYHPISFMEYFISGITVLLAVLGLAAFRRREELRRNKSTKSWV